MKGKIYTLALAALTMALTTTLYAEGSDPVPGSDTDQKLASLDSRLKTLENKIQLCGFAQAAMTTDFSDGQAALYDTVGDNATKLRTQLELNGPDYGIKTRIDLLANTDSFTVTDLSTKKASTSASVANPQQGKFTYANLCYAYPYIYLFNKMVKFSGGLVFNNSDFCTYAYANDGVNATVFKGLGVNSSTSPSLADPKFSTSVLGGKINTGYYGGAAGFETLVYPIPGMSLGVFVPATSTAAPYSSTDLSNGVGTALDYNIKYTFKDWGTIGGGYLGGDCSGTSGASCSDSQAYLRGEFKSTAIPEWVVSGQYGMYLRKAAGFEITQHQGFFSTAYCLGALGLPGLRLAQDCTIGLDQSSTYWVSSLSQVKYTIKGLLPGAVQLIPLAQFRYYTLGSAWAVGFEPKLSFCNPGVYNLTFAFGGYDGSGLAHNYGMASTLLTVNY